MSSERSIIADVDAMLILYWGVCGALNCADCLGEDVYIRLLDT